MVEWPSMQTVLLTLAPFLLPFFLNLGRRLIWRSPKVPKDGLSEAPRPIVRAPPPGVRRALNFLFVGSVVAFLTTLPIFTPENILARTGSTINTPSDVLWDKVAALRPDGQLTEVDEALRDRFRTRDGRRLFMTYGSDIVANCPFCRTDQPDSFLIYALPALLLPHFLHLCLLGLATSSVISDREGRRWRMTATILGLSLAVIDCLLVYTHETFTGHDDVQNPFFWRARFARGIGLAIIDAVAAAWLWATSTNRIWPATATASMRLDAVRATLERTANKLNGLDILRHTVAQTASLRRAAEARAANDTRVWDQLWSDAAVQQTANEVRNAGNLDIPQITRDADDYARQLVAITKPD